MSTPMEDLNFSELLDSVYNYYQQNNLAIDDTYITEICSHVDKFSIISFDIFDTVLTRLFECPIDVFAYVENLLNIEKIQLQDFAINRIKAEEEARISAMKQELREEITLEDIYQQLAIFYPYHEKELYLAKKLELLAEKQSIIPVNDNQQLIKKLKQLNKKIIFVSDIYLSKEFIQELLAEKNISEYDELYVSAELLKTKHTGSIWQEVLKNNPNQNILHIGDNLHADVTQPKKFGIDTFHYVRHLGERRIGAQLSSNLIPFSLISKMDNLYHGFSKNESDKETVFWKNLGRTLGGMMLQSFTSWLSKEIIKNKIDHIYFCARDAQIIQKIWGLLDYDAKCHTTSSYLYLSRKVLRLPVCHIELANHNKLSENSISFLLNESIQNNDTYRTYFKRLNIDTNFISKTRFKKIFGSLDSQINFNKLEELKHFLERDLLPALRGVFQQQYQSTLAYCQQEGLFDESKKIALVDIGWGGTIQMALGELRHHMGLSSNLYGFYYGLLNHNAVGRLYKSGPMNAAFFNMFWGPEEQFLHLNSVVIIENLHSADHETTIGFKLNTNTQRYEPILKDDKNSHHSNFYYKSIDYFRQGIEESIGKWQQGKTVYGIERKWIQPSFTTAALAQICITPNADEQRYLGSIYHAALHDHSVFHRLIDSTLPTNEEDVQKIISQAQWPCGLMSYWKQHRGEIKKGLYQYSLDHIGIKNYPEIISNYFIN